MAVLLLWRYEQACEEAGVPPERNGRKKTDADRPAAAPAPAPAPAPGGDKTAERERRKTPKQAARH